MTSKQVLTDIRSAVEDFPEMRQRMVEALDQSKASLPNKSGEDDLVEAREFLQWLNDKNFTYLGYPRYQSQSKRWSFDISTSC